MIELDGTVDYMNKDGKAVFRTLPAIEKSRLVFQMGSASPELALQAAEMVVEDVSGFDLNCGCPKHFSLQGGMGAALLKKPELLCQVNTRILLKTDFINVEEECAC